MPAGCPGTTRLLVGKVGGGGSVAGVANMAGWRWVGGRREKGEVERLATDRWRFGLEAGRLLRWGEGGRWCLGRGRLVLTPPV